MLKEETLAEGSWKNFVHKHPGASILGIAGAIAVLAAAILVFLWTVSNAQSNGLVPIMLGEWTMGYVISFILYVAYWELLLVASWAVPLGLLVYFIWYRRLPAKERKEYEKKSFKKDDRGGLPALANLLWVGIVWYTGLWDKPFQNWALNEWVSTWITAWIVVLGFTFLMGTAYVIHAVSKAFK